ncbi:hypothetical protein CWE23_00395 [Idiomarina aquatica]|uniref:Uncharacterized protein n=2 Tax=Idiomarina aquatica TaxID=1327752 RepID=A0AA94EEY1_9GAMM|nr:hypothetical protein CWE23_00395 [Idiomarina aquatica]
MLENIDMATYKIEFRRLLEDAPEKRLFSGRSNGEKAHEFFKLDHADKTDFFELEVPEEVVVSSSYFLGMLEDIMRKYDSVDELKQHLDSSSLKGDTLAEYKRALKRGFYTNRGFF